MRASVPVATLRLLLAQLAIGAAAIFARLALQGTGPVTASALRLGIAALPLAAVAFLSQKRARALGARRETIFVAAGLLLALHFATWIASLQWTSVAVSTLLVCTTPLWTELAQAVGARRLPERSALLALALAFAGIVLIALDRTTPAPVPGHALEGDALALAGALAIGAYLIVVRRYGAQPPVGDPIPTAQIVARTYGWAAVALSFAAIATKSAPPAPNDGRAWFGIAAMALVSQLLGHTALNASLRVFTPSVVALTTLLEPVIAAVLASLVFGEHLSPFTYAGGVLVLCAVARALSAHAVGPGDRTPDMKFPEARASKTAVHPPEGPYK